MMANFVLEDATGSIETLVFPDAFAASYKNLIDDAVVVVAGSVKSEADSLRFFATEVTPLSEHKGLERKVVYVDIDLENSSEMQVHDLVELINTNKGETQLSLRLKKSSELDVELFSKGFGISSSSAVMTRLQEIAGHDNVRMSRQRNHFSIS
jgi:DNA polymerase III alpha subunit